MRFFTKTVNRIDKERAAGGPKASSEAFWKANARGCKLLQESNLHPLMVRFANERLLASGAGDRSLRSLVLPIAASGEREPASAFIARSIGRRTSNPTEEETPRLMNGTPSGSATLRAPSARRSFARHISLVGRSAAMNSIKSVASTVAPRQCTVMILGETGAGKEMVARYIHAQSDRCDAPLIPVDCSALSDTLFESQMFGHVQGAFTGAVRESLGFVRAADGGTLFLDEVGELSLPLQAKLLRVIQERCVTPVGDTRAHEVDVRIIAATHRDLAAMVREGTFRQDLYFRLNVVVTTLPPLRERAEDILPLANHFLQKQADLYDEPVRRLSHEAAVALERYSWPGNVRELANAMESAHVLAQGEVIELADLPIRLQSSRPTPIGAPELCLTELERRTIAEALRRTDYCKAKASRMLGINIQRLNRRIERLNISTRQG
jgi:transcriptional regulator with PAS, ATPase and Fis domain